MSCRTKKSAWRWAVLDPITELANQDEHILAALLGSIQTEDSGLKALLASLEREITPTEFRQREVNNGIYTAKISTPVYEPKGVKPDLFQLADDSKAKQLTLRIQASALAPQEKAFLYQAASRHIVFDYRAIAEYYCHASPELQALMEESALVIIDFNKAVENGYVDLTEKLMKLQSVAGSDAK